MRLAAALVLVLALVGCSAPSAPVLPGASITPHLATRSVAPACGVDVSWYGSTAPDVRYRFTYDEHGRVAQARGTYARNAGAELAEYTWDNLDHMVQLVQTRDFDDARAEIVAHYNTLGDLVEYTWRMADGLERYLYTDFNETGLPTRQVVSQNGVESQLQLQYDARGRIVLAIPDKGAPTIYSYDDDARTTTIDTGNGAYRGVLVYDERNRQLSETWDGTDPSLIANQELYEWDGDRLLTITHRQATSEAPHELRTVSVDTYRYDCASR